MVETKILYTIIVVVVAFLLDIVLRQYFGYKIKKYLPRTTRTLPVKTIINVSLFTLTILALIAVWGVSFENLWIYVTSVLGLIAIGLFAVWSILSNVIAGFIILGTKKFRRDDEIVLMPDKIRGKVKYVSLMFTVLEDKKYRVHVPNNLFFQRYTKVKRRKKT